MPTKGINLNSLEDRILTQRKANWYKTWGVPNRFPINPPDTDPRNDYSPANFLP